MLKGIPISGGRTVGVKFNHDFNGRRDTCAWLIINLGDATWVSAERAKFNPIDRYDRNKGRKIALTKALKTLTDESVLEPWQLLSKEDRTAIWKAYFEARNGKYE